MFVAENYFKNFTCVWEITAENSGHRLFEGFRKKKNRFLKVDVLTK